MILNLKSSPKQHSIFSFNRAWADMSSGALRVYSWILLVVFCFGLSACELPHQPGTMPTEIVATEFEPGLNILGVLRADGIRGTSFININRALTTEEIYGDTIENFSPVTDFVRVRSHSSGLDHEFILENDPSDWSDYRDTTLLVSPGDRFDLEISAPEYPVLTAQTQVPLTPELVENSLSISADRLSFQLQYDASAFEYKLFLIFADQILEKVVKPATDDIIPVEWSLSNESEAPLYLMLAALDENLTRYGNSPISFIPNTYHADASTVEGGYGCFGSVAVNVIEL